MKITIISFNIVNNTGTDIYFYTKALKKKMANIIAEQMKNTEGIFEEITKTDIRRAITSKNCKFDFSGLTVFFDETMGFGSHALGTVSYFIPYTEIAEYIKESKIQF